MISVLMSVYAREVPAALDAALASLVAQTVRPAEVVLVRDGPLTPELDAVITPYAAALPLRTIALDCNQGLAAALNRGLQKVTQPWVMRFDSDDICVPERIAIQSAIMARGDVDVFGGQIDEFETDVDSAHRSRRVPLEHAGILRFARRRNPFNHMTVCYRTEMARAAGGYPAIPFMEDYALWIELLASDARAANCPEILVHARVGNGMIARRGGVAYVHSEWRLQGLMRRLGFKSRVRCLVDGVLRSSVFLAPHGVRSLVYEKALRDG